MQEENNEQKIVEEYSRQINRLEGETSFWIGKSEQYRKLLKETRKKYKAMKRTAIIWAVMSMALAVVTVCIYVWG